MIRSNKPRKCAVCKSAYTPFQSMQKVCGSMPCMVAAGQAKTLKDRAKREQEERAKTRVQKEALKTRSQWMKEAQHAFNAYIRQRDSGRPCICCGRTETAVTGLSSHGWDCGHYRSVGSAPHLRFHEDNAHRQLVLCNRYGAGRAVDYRIGLVKRLGIAAVESLENDNTVRKFSIDELKAIKATYKGKLKMLLADKEVA